MFLLSCNTPCLPDATSLWPLVHRAGGARTYKRKPTAQCSSNFRMATELRKQWQGQMPPTAKGSAPLRARALAGFIPLPAPTAWTFPMMHLHNTQAPTRFPVSGRMAIVRRLVRLSRPGALPNLRLKPLTPANSATACQLCTTRVTDRPPHLSVPPVDLFVRKAATASNLQPHIHIPNFVPLNRTLLCESIQVWDIGEHI